MLENVISAEDFTQGKFVALYGKSGSGKTTLGGSFPKPMLYVQIGDDGFNAIKDIKGIDILEKEELKSVNNLPDLIEELESDTKYKSVFFDTFSLFVSEWRKENIYSKNRKMSQPAWGELLEATEEIISALNRLAKKKWVIISGHEVMDSIEGMEGELLPDVRLSVSKGARTYLEGMVNYGFHTIIIEKEVEKNGVIKTVAKYAIDMGANPYYWTKCQSIKSKKIPKRMFNPSYKKLKELLEF